MSQKLQSSYKFAKEPIKELAVTRLSVAKVGLTDGFGGTG